MINRNFKYTFIVTLFSLAALSCESEDDNQIDLKTQGDVKISLPLKVDQNSVFVSSNSSGRTNSVTSNDMDMLGVLIESSPLGQNTFSSYASGVFTTIPDSLDLILQEGNDYYIRAFFYNNNVDSVYNVTIDDYIDDINLANELLYGNDMIPFFDRFKIYAEGARYYRSVANTSFGGAFTQFPIIDHYFAETPLSLDVDTLEALEFKQHNTRFEISIQNATPDSRVKFTMENFQSPPIDKDTTFNLDFKQHASAAFTGNDIDINVVHDYFENDINFTQTLYEDNLTLDRLEIIRIEVTVPDVNDTGNIKNSDYVFIEESFTRGDTIRVGG